MKKICLLLASLSIALVLTGCGGDSSKGKEVGKSTTVKETEKGTTIEEIEKSENPNPATRRGMSLNLNSGGKFSGASNPAISSTSYDSTINSYVFSSLLTVDLEKNFIPSDITESFSFNSKDNSFTFKLKKGVKFSDGVELTSEDVKFTYSLYARPEYTGRSGYVSVTIKGNEAVTKGDELYISGIETPDKYTVVFNLVEANARSYNNFLGRILPKHYYEYAKDSSESLSKREEAYNKEFLGKNEKPIGSGAYKLTEYKAGEYVILEAFDDFILGAPEVRKIVSKYIPNDSVSPSLATGSLDIAALSGKTSKQKEIASKNGLVNYQRSTPGSYSYIGFNLDKPLLQEKALRKALAIGLNRKLYAEKILEGEARVLNQPLSKDHWAYNNNKDEINEYNYDVDKANKILEDSGWKIGDDGFRYRDGKKLSFVLHTSQDQTSTGKVLVALIKENWKQIGVDVDIQLIDFNAMVKDLQSENPRYDTVMLAWTTIVDPDPTNIYGTGGKSNFGNYSNKKVDRLMKEGLSVMDKESRTPIYHEIMKEINEDLPYIFLVEKFGTVGINKRIKGLDYLGDMGVWKATKTNEIELIN